MIGYGGGWEGKGLDPMCIARVSAVYSNPANSVEDLQAWLAVGVFNVLVHDGVTFDSACAECNGQVWDIYYALDHVQQHPNCTRTFTPANGPDMISLAIAAQRAVEENCFAAE
jgi:hypothetical protein